MLSHPSPNHSRRAVPCVAVCVHWTGGSFASALDWCQRSVSKVSYHEIIGPDGQTATLVAPDRAAWSVGRSIAPHPWSGTSGNSMTYNIALSGAPPAPPTDAQRRALVRQIRKAFAHFGWPLEFGHRITGHHDWAAPRGRKVDPVGSDPMRPWLDLVAVRRDVAGLP
jgi:N-acetyl-anhydromuramyl-L-alanine amidase AmpD